MISCIHGWLLNIHDSHLKVALYIITLVNCYNYVVFCFYELEDWSLVGFILLLINPLGKGRDKISPPTFPRMFEGTNPWYIHPDLMSLSSLPASRLFLRRPCMSCTQRSAHRPEFYSILASFEEQSLPRTHFSYTAFLASDHGTIPMEANEQRFTLSARAQFF